LAKTIFAKKFRFGACGKINPNVNTLQNCPGYSQSVFQVSSTSEDDDDKASGEYQYYRQIAQVFPHWPPLAQNITDTRGVLDDDD